MTERVYILLPVHNRREITRKFVDCLLAQTWQNYHLLLMDDGSVDGTGEAVRECVPAEKLTVIRGKGDWWWAGGLQQGLDWLKRHSVDAADIVLMTNDDVHFNADFIEKGVKFLQVEPETLLLARYYDEEKQEVAESGVKADLKRFHFKEAVSPGEINCLSTRGLFLRWGDCVKIGDFYPRLLPHYGSDYEYTIRAGRKGLALKTSSEVYLVPDYAATGVRSTEQIRSLKVLFSKRCVSNPVYRTTFILLVVPWYWIPSNIIKIWRAVFRRMFEKAA